MLQKIARRGLFWTQAVRQYSQIGAVAPSSRFLARRMVNKLGTVAPGSTVVELGPGTGAITKYLLAERRDMKVLAIEANQRLSVQLEKQFPTVQVVNGCATKLEDHLATHGLSPEQIGGVVSGLPLLNFDQDLRWAILDSVQRILPTGRKFVAFTYARKGWKFPVPEELISEPRARVMRNIPPASVLTFEKSE